MTDNLDANLFRGKIASGVTLYVEVPVRNGVDGGRFLGCQVAWLDATSSATITLELTSYRHAGAQDTSATMWIDSGLTFTGPAATAAGGLLINVENVRQLRARLKIVTAAITTLDIRDGTVA